MLTITPNKIREAKKLIENGWTKGTYFRDQYGKSRYGFKPGYKCCLIGDCEVVLISPEHLRLIMVNYPKNRGLTGLIRFNDNLNTTKEDVIEFLDYCESKVKELYA